MGPLDSKSGDFNPFDRESRNAPFDPILGSSLEHGGDIIYFSANFKDVIHELHEIERKLEENFRNGLLKKLADNSTKRIRRNVSAAETNATQIERHRGRAYATIGFSITKTDTGPTAIIGAIKGTAWGRQIVGVHDENIGAYSYIFARPNNRAGGWMLIPAKDGIAFDSFKDQIYGANDLKTLKSQGSIFKYWNTEAAIWIQRSKGGPKEVAFFKTKSVRIPGRSVVTGDFVKAEADLARLLPTTIEASLELKTVRI